MQHNIERGRINIGKRGLFDLRQEPQKKSPRIKKRERGSGRQNPRAGRTEATKIIRTPHP